MMNARNTPPAAAHGDIVNSELIAMLETVVEAHCGLWEIHQLLDKASTMSEIRARFARWQVEQQAPTGKSQ